jgi:hypothetical protein
MVWAGHLEKLLKVIGKLSCLVLEVTLGSSNVLLIGVTVLLVVVALIASRSNSDLLGAPILLPLVAFGAPLRAFADCLGQFPLAAIMDCLPITLDKNGPTASSPEVCWVVMSRSSFVVLN